MRVKEIMKSPVITIGKEARVSAAVALMAEHGVRHLPVVQDGALVGIVTDRDCRQARASSAPSLSKYELLYLLERLRVGEVMSRNVVTVTPETPALDAAALMSERKIGSLPVLEGTAVVGIVTTTDMLAALSGMLEVRRPATVRRVLAPTDFSGPSARAVEYARLLAEERGAELILFHVVAPPSPSALEGASPGWALDQIQGAREEEALARLREAFPDGGRIRYQVATGSPEVEIALAARTERADMIVMGTHRRAGLSGFLASSMTEEVIRRAPCPVIALRG